MEYWLRICFRFVLCGMEVRVKKRKKTNRDRGMRNLPVHHAMREGAHGYCKLGLNRQRMELTRTTTAIRVSVSRNPASMHVAKWEVNQTGRNNKRRKSMGLSWKAASRPNSCCPKASRNWRSTFFFFPSIKETRGLVLCSISASVEDYCKGGFATWNSHV